MKFVLIIWFTAYNHGASSTVVEGFSTLDNCQKAKTQITTAASKNISRGSELVRGYCIGVE